MINNTSFGSGTLQAYVNSLIARSNNAGADPAAAAGGTDALKKSSQTALDSAAKSYKSSAAQRVLQDQQTKLGADLKASLAKAGVKLEGAIEFSLDAKGNLSVKGSDKDKASVNAFLKNDTSKPDFASRISSLTQAADELSSTIRQTAAISQAARYASTSGDVMLLYSTLVKQQDTTASVFSLSASSSSLTYPGVLASKA